MSRINVTIPGRLFLVPPGAWETWTSGNVATIRVTSRPGVRFHTLKNGRCLIGSLEALFAPLCLAKVDLTGVF
jgi:hypothetical protein